MSYREYMSGSDVILGIAPNGYRYSQQTNTALPIDPDEIADHVAECVDLGTTVAHLHGRDEDGDSDPRHLPSVGAAVRDRCGGDVLVEYAVAPKHPLGDLMDAVEHRPRPDLASVPLGPALYDYRGASRVSRRDVDRLVAELADSGVKPNLLVRGGRGVNELARLRDRDLLEGPPLVTLLLGSTDGTVATPRTLQALVGALPDDARCMVRATGPNQFPLTTLALLLGGHVTVGMEDNLYLDHETPVEHNTQLVGRVRDVLEHSQRSLADATTAANRLELSAAADNEDLEPAGTTRP